MLKPTPSAFGEISESCSNQGVFMFKTLCSDRCMQYFISKEHQQCYLFYFKSKQFTPVILARVKMLPSWVFFLVDGKNHDKMLQKSKEIM